MKRIDEKKLKEGDLIFVENGRERFVGKCIDYQTNLCFILLYNLSNGFNIDDDRDEILGFIEKDKIYIVSKEEIVIEYEL